MAKAENREKSEKKTRRVTGHTLPGMVLGPAAHTIR
jgi:hypothetical protein